MARVKSVVQVKLIPSPDQAAALEATLRMCNREANRISEAAFRSGRRGRAALQSDAYRGLKAAGLSAQPALHVIRKVADAYSALAANLKAGSFGKPASKGRVNAGPAASLRTRIGTRLGTSRSGPRCFGLPSTSLMRRSRHSQWRRPAASLGLHDPGR